MRIKQAKYIDGYKIEILFSNGVSKIVDFSRFLKTAKHVFVPLKDIEYFKKFVVDDITLSWPNNADFDPELLYEMGVEMKKENKKASPRKVGKATPSSTTRRTLAARSKLR